MQSTEEIMSHLPILVPGRSSPVLVPCRLPEAITYRAFLPSRGVRTFCMWFDTTDSLKAEVKDVTLAMPDKNPPYVLGRGAYALTEDETTRAWEAAGDVFLSIRAGLAIPGAMRYPVGQPAGSVLCAIAKAWEAEEDAVAAGCGLLNLFKDASHREAIDKCIPDLTAPSGQETSAACEALRCYVDMVVDAACVAQADKAEKQAAEWEPPPRHPEDENPPTWAERHEVTP